MNEKIMEILSSGLPRGLKELAEAMALSQAEAQTALDALMAEGDVVKTRKGRYTTANGSGLVKARISFQRNGTPLARPMEGGTAMQVEVSGAARCMPDDLVLVRPMGIKCELHTILRRGRDAFAAYVRIEQKARKGARRDEVKMLATAVPCDLRLPYEVVLTGDLSFVRNDQIARLKIEKFPEYNRPIYASVERVLGNGSSMCALMKAVAEDHDFATESTTAVEAEAASMPAEVSAADIQGREDLRGLLTFTIDGATAKDFDDAISIEKTADGWRLGVHIADVSHYVTPGSPLDVEAWRRGTSVYYPGHVVPMLPFELSNGICSLNPNVDRLAFSAFIELDRTGQRYGAKFAKTVIRSAARMTYKKVNAILSGDAALREEYAPLVPIFEEMNELAHALYKRRVDRGALEMDLPESAITVDETGEPVEITFRERGESEKLIEEFMLLANESVAEHMHRHGWPTVYRVHDDPDPEKLRSFAMFARPFGYRIDPSKTADTAQLQAVLTGAKDDPRQRALPTLLLRSLSRARYDLNCGGHYGLQAKFYLHFTSPIRRYPDLVAHRMLQKALTGAQFDPADEGTCAEAAAQSTEREFAADTAERDIDKLYLAAYMEQFIGEEFDAEVSGVTSFGLFVSLANSVEGLIRMDSLPDDYYEYDEEAMVLTGRHRGRRYTMGTPIRVRLLSASRITGQIDFAAADTQILRKD